MREMTELEEKLRACDRIAYFIEQTTKDEFQADTRILLDPFIYNRLTYAGASKQFIRIGGKKHDEHVVPRKLIRDESAKMFRAGSSRDEVTRAISRHLHVVRITPEEWHKIDNELSLKTVMPKGWIWNKSCPFERLREGGIEFEICDLALSAIGVSRDNFEAQSRVT